MSLPEEKGIRLNRFLASCGVGSRRSCESLILEGRVEINGEIVLDLSRRILPDDYVRLDGKLLRQDKPLTLLLNKPVGYLCTKHDPQNRKTIYDLLPHKFASVHYIGRLDNKSSGLLLLTNSGELTEKLTHPRFHVEKEYAVKLERPFDPELVPRLLKGIQLTEGLAKAESVFFESRRKLRVVLTQGFYRQIRRMFKKLDYEVKNLERVRIGSLTVPDLSTGEYRILNHREVEAACTNPK